LGEVVDWLGVCKRNFFSESWREKQYWREFMPPWLLANQSLLHYRKRANWRGFSFTDDI